MGLLHFKTMGSEGLLLESLCAFYENEAYGQEFVSVVRGERGISLRSIDWFITNYSKKNNVYYLIHTDASELPTFDESVGIRSRAFNVHNSYKSQLKAYSKKRFDPFCRRNRISLEIAGESVETTIGQLNFFRWAIENLVTEYIFNHKATIEGDMNTCLKNIKGKHPKKTGTRKRREELSRSATRGLSRTNLEVEINFD